MKFIETTNDYEVEVIDVLDEELDACACLCGLTSGSGSGTGVKKE